jgi:outer membrane biosynthesis protein TonB
MNKIALKASGNGKLSISALEHPNRMPFSGVLTYLNRLSTEPPHGANGLRVFIPTDVGAPAVASLKGMAINYIEGNPTGHDPKSKIGVITEAYLGETQSDGAVPVVIEGFVYAHDFSEAAASIKASQSSLGFSYETAQTQLVKGEVDGVPAAIVTSLGYFTGASVLYKLSASYADTSLAASKETKEETNVDLEKLLADLKEFVGGEIKALRDEFKPAEPVVEPVVEPAVEPVVEPVVEPAPSVEPVVEPAVEPVVEPAPAVEPVVEPVVEPKVEDAQLNASSLLAELKALKDELASLKSEANIQASARKSVAYPTTAIAKYGLDEEADKTKLMASIDAKASELSIEERFQMKFEALNKLNQQ